MAVSGIVWVHPRPGLLTPYLGKEWFRMWKISLREAERLGLEHDQSGALDRESFQQRVRRELKEAPRLK